MAAAAEAVVAAVGVVVDPLAEVVAAAVAVSEVAVVGAAAVVASEVEEAVAVLVVAAAALEEEDAGDINKHYKMFFPHTSLHQLVKLLEVCQLEDRQTDRKREREREKERWPDFFFPVLSFPFIVRRKRVRSL